MQKKIAQISSFAIHEQLAYIERNHGNTPIHNSLKVIKMLLKEAAS